MPAKPKKRAMTDEHKSALAEGRNHARIVGRYLEALEAHKPKRGRRRTADSVKKRLGVVETELAATVTPRGIRHERRDPLKDRLTAAGNCPLHSGLLDSVEPRLQEQRQSPLQPVFGPVRHG